MMRYTYDCYSDFGNDGFLSESEGELYSEWESDGFLFDD